MTKKTYDANSVQQLSFREGVRQRVGMYLGSPDIEGATNGLFEIISNSVDEAIIGAGKQIEIQIWKKAASVKDYGRGIPRGPKGEIKEVLITLLTESHSGAKFNDDNYTSVRGLNGIGSGATCCSSDYFKVITKRDGYEWSLEFKAGIPLTETAIRGKETKETGTFIYFEPSQEVFSAEPFEFNYETISKKVKDMSYLLPGIIFHITNMETNEKEEFCSKNGIVDLLNDVVKNPVHKSVIVGKMSDGINTVEIAVKWTKGSERFYCFVNGAECPDGGSPITGIKSAITRILNKELKGGFSGDVVRRGLIYIVSCSVKSPLFANQTKTKISNPELRGLADRIFADSWKDFALRNPHDVESINDFLTKEEKADRAADKARQAVINGNRLTSDSRKDKNPLGAKLSDCAIHDEKSMLFIVEGKSAMGSVMNGRDSKYMAGLPIRGKIISALKNDIDDVLANEEVIAIIKALGCGIFEKINLEKLRYGKICIMSDADVDGLSISVLLLTLFYKIMPELLHSGKVYATQMPLYKIAKGKDVCYTYTEEEQAKAKKPAGAHITRFKGLGEMTPEDLRATIFSLNDGRLIQMTMEDGIAAARMFELLMGDNVEPRRNYIFENLDFSKLIE